nr:hypothetical protein [uncultured Mucilaginibacter sp.]
MNTYHERGRPPYLLGLLGFIPLVGAFVGLGLMFYGIFSYRSKALTGIGLACILFTVLIYSSLFAYTGSNDVKKGFVPIVHDQLNSLVKNIEFFKIQYGNYPDSLPQLSKDDGTVFIVDPLQAISKSENPYYRYKRVGDGYYLSSNGVDGEAGTQDDIYPVPPKLKNAKVGLLKEGL